MARLVDGDRIAHSGASESHVWHVLVGADDSHRVSLDELDAMFQRHEVTEDTLVWRKGMREWIKLGLAVGLGSDDPESSASEPPARPPLSEPTEQSLSVSDTSGAPEPGTGALASQGAVAASSAHKKGRPSGVSAGLPPPPRPPMASRDLDAGRSSSPAGDLPRTAPRTSSLPPAPRVSPNLALGAGNAGDSEASTRRLEPSGAAGDWVKELMGEDEPEEGALTTHRRRPVPPPSGPPPGATHTVRPRMARPVPPPSMPAPGSAAASTKSVPPPTALPGALKGPPLQSPVLQEATGAPASATLPIPGRLAPPPGPSPRPASVDLASARSAASSQPPPPPPPPSGPQHVLSSVPVAESGRAPGRPPPPSSIPPRTQGSRPSVPAVPAPPPSVPAVLAPPPSAAPAVGVTSRRPPSPPPLVQSAVAPPAAPTAVLLESSAPLDERPRATSQRVEAWIWAGAAVVVLLVAAYRNGVADAVGLGDVVERLEQRVFGGAPFGTPRSVRELVSAHPVDHSPVPVPGAATSGNTGRP